MAVTAKALTSISTFSKRVHNQRINRRLDDRDNLLKEGLKNIEERSASNYPEIQSLSADLVNLGTSSPLTDLVLTGVNFEGDTEKASGETSSSAGAISFEAVLPGVQTITVTIVDDGTVLAVDADPSAGTVEVTHGDGGASTAAAIVAAINADAEAKYMVNATVDTAGAMDADEDVTLSGGTGDLMTLSLGDVAVDGTASGTGITDVSDTEVTFDFDATGLTDGEGQVLALRVDGYLCAPVTLVANASSISSSEIADGAVTSDKLATIPALVDLTPAAEAADVIAVTVNLVDLEGDDLDRAQRLLCEVFKDDMTQASSAEFTLAETGSGSEVSTTAKPRLLIDTDASGDATVSITDVAGASGATVFLQVTPVSTSTNVPGHPRIIEVTFDGV